MRSSSALCGPFLAGAAATFLAGFWAAGFLLGFLALATFLAAFFFAGLADFLAGAALAFFLAAFRAKILLSSGGEI